MSFLIRHFVKINFFYFFIAIDCNFKNSFYFYSDLITNYKSLF